MINKIKQLELDLMVSISDKLKAVVMSGVITASSLSGASAMAADGAQQSANALPAATQTAKQQYHAYGSTLGSFENLFLNPEVGKQLPDEFWNKGKEFSEKVKVLGAKKKYWPIELNEGVPPVTQFMPGYPKVPIPGGALNVRQFADYVKFVTLNGDPRKTAAGPPNTMLPRAFVGVITPDNSLDPMWRKRMADAYKEAFEIQQKYAESHGAWVSAVVRVIADDNETILREATGKKMSLKDGIIVIFPNRPTSNIVYNMYDLEGVLEYNFTRNYHLLTNREFFCEPGSDLSKSKVCAPPGQAQNGNADTGKAGGGKGAAGSGKVAAADGPGL